MAVEGTLELFKLPEILQLISQQRKTGILTVQGQQDIIAISFLDGKIVAADALNQTVEEGLAQVLVAEGLMGAGDFSRAVAEQQAAGGRMVDFLIERRYVARPEALRALRIQTTRLLEQLLRWDKGEFKFYGGDEVSYEEGFVPIAVDELLFQAAQKGVTSRPALAPPPRPAAAPPATEAAAARPGPVPVPAGGAAAEAPAGSPAGRPGLRVVRKDSPPAAAPAPRAVPVPAPVETETAGPFRKMRVEAASTGPGARPLLAKLLACALAALSAAVLLTRPEALILPFPWQDRERAALAQDQRASQGLKIDRAAKAYFLLEGHFPASLAELRQEGLLSRSDLRDPQGHPIRYAAGEESYALESLQGGKPVPGTESSEAITGNFLLDPEFLNLPADSSAPPLVLLD